MQLLHCHSGNGIPRNLLVDLLVQVVWSPAACLPCTHPFFQPSLHALPIYSPCAHTHTDTPIPLQHSHTFQPPTGRGYGMCFLSDWQRVQRPDLKDKPPQVRDGCKEGEWAAYY